MLDYRAALVRYLVPRNFDIKQNYLIKTNIENVNNNFYFKKIQSQI